MNFLEKDLEDLIWAYCNSEEGYKILRDRKLFFHTRTFRQFKLGNYGIVDLMNVTYDQSIERVSIQLVELKKEPLKVQHLVQICRYVSGLRSMVDEIDPDKIMHNAKVRGILIVPNVDLNSDIIFLTNLLHKIRIYTYRFSLEKGLVFEPLERDWGLKNCTIYHTEFAKWNSSHFVPEYDNGNLLDEFNEMIKAKVNGQETH